MTAIGWGVAALIVLGGWCLAWALCVAADDDLDRPADDDLDTELRELLDQEGDR